MLELVVVVAVMVLCGGAGVISAGCFYAGFYSRGIGPMFHPRSYTRKQCTPVLRPRISLAPPRAVGPPAVSLNPPPLPWKRPRACLACCGPPLCGLKCTRGVVSPSF